MFILIEITDEICVYTYRFQLSATWLLNYIAEYARMLTVVVLRLLTSHTIWQIVLFQLKVKAKKKRTIHIFVTSVHTHLANLRVKVNGNCRVVNGQNRTFIRMLYAVAD